MCSGWPTHKAARQSTWVPLSLAAWLGALAALVLLKFMAIPQWPLIAAHA